MAITSTPSTFYANGKQPFVGYDNEIVSGLEITCADNPAFLGKFYDELRRDGNDLMDFFARAKESTHDGKYITWDEEVRNSQRFNAPGLITRTGNSFVIDNDAITDTLNDFNLCNDGDGIFYDFPVGTEVKIIDAAGVEQHGFVTAVSADLQTATIQNSTGGTAWTVATTNLTIIPLGREVPYPDDCGACFRTNYNPATYMNNFVKLDTCITVDEEDFLDRGSVYRIDTTNGYYRYSESAQNALLDLYADTYKKMMFSKKVQVDTPIANGTPKWTGLSGVIEQVEERGFIWDGMIADKSDLRDIAAQFDYVKSNNKHYIDASIAQYNALEDIPYNETDMQLSYAPYACCVEDFPTYGIKGMNIGGHEFYFRKWGITQSSAFEATSFGEIYHFLIQPYNPNVIMFKNGKTYNQSHLNIVWAGNEHTNWKLLRKSDMGSSTCTSYDVRYITKFSIAVALAHHWMIGKS